MGKVFVSVVAAAALVVLSQGGGVASADTGPAPGEASRSTTSEVLGAVEAQSTDAAMALSVASVETCFTTGPCEIEMLVENTSDASLRDVVVTEHYCEVGVNGPKVVTGDGDEVLDPGEVWRYTCLHESEFLGTAVAQVSAITPDGMTVTAEGFTVFETVSPVAIDASSESTRTVAGEPVTWLITVENVGNFPLVNMGVEGRVLYPGWIGPVSFADAIGPNESDMAVGGAMAPAETWTWTYSQVVLIDASYLEVRVSAAPQSSPLSGFGETASSVALEVEPTPASTPAETDEPSTSMSVQPDTAELANSGATHTTKLVGFGLLLIATGAAAMIGGPRYG